MANEWEAIAFVLDVGNSMHSNQSCSSILEEAKKCICTIIQRKIFLESRDQIALILFGTSHTFEVKKNGFKNIVMVQDLQFPSWKFIDYVKQIKATSISTDLIRANALLSAIQFLRDNVKPRLISSQKIFFITNFDGFISGKEIKEIYKKMMKYDIGLNVIGPDAFSIDDINFEPCQNERLDIPKAVHISKILKKVNGESYSFNDVLNPLTYCQIKAIRSCTWNANLELEMPDPSKSLTIPISAYIKVSERWPKRWEMDSNDLKAAMKHRLVNCVDDGLQTEISNEKTYTAYKYGTSVIPFLEDIAYKVQHKPGEKGIKVLGFTESVNMKPYLYIDCRVMYVFARTVANNTARKYFKVIGKMKKERQRRNPRIPLAFQLAGPQLAAFIQALHDTEMVAIAHFLYSPKSVPIIGFLSPRIKKNFEHLIFIALPFKEDICHYVFPSFSTKSENIPTEEQLDAIDELINAMDLTNPDTKKKDDRELLKPKNTPNPLFQRMLQCLEFRALNPDKPLPEIAPHIEALVNPSTELLNKAEKPLKRIESLFPLEKVDPKEHRNIYHPPQIPIQRVNVHVQGRKKPLSFTLSDSNTENMQKIQEINRNILKRKAEECSAKKSLKVNSISLIKLVTDSSNTTTDKITEILNPEKPIPKITSNFKTTVNPSPELLKAAKKPIPIKPLFPSKELRIIIQKKVVGHPVTKSLNANSAAVEKNAPVVDLTKTTAETITEVGTVNPVRDFQYLVWKKVLPFDVICDQLMNVVYKYLKTGEASTRSRMCHSEILSICKEFRQTSLLKRNPDKYNNFMINLKYLLLECEKELWNKIRKEKIGLISKLELQSSTVYLRQAEMFLADTESKNEDDNYIAVQSIEIKEEKGDNNLLDQS